VWLVEGLGEERISPLRRSQKARTASVEMTDLFRVGENRQRRRRSVRLKGSEGFGGLSSSGFLRQAQDRLFDYAVNRVVNSSAQDDDSSGWRLDFLIRFGETNV
jgi:hypothetical protein